MKRILPPSDAVRTIRTAAAAGAAAKPYGGTCRIGAAEPEPERWNTATAKYATLKH